MVERIPRAIAFRRLCGYLGFSGPIIFAAASVIAGSVQFDYSTRREDLSALAALDAHNAWIMITGMVALGLCTSALGLGLRGAIVDGDAAKVGSIMLFALGLVITAAGLMRNDCSTELKACTARVGAGDVSWHHHGHDMMSITIYFIIIIAPLVFAEAFRTDPQWRDLRTYCRLTAPVSFALLVISLSTSIALPNWQGIFQRLLIATAFTWLAVLGLRLARLNTGSR